MKYYLFVFCILISFDSNSQSQKEKSNDCDLTCGALEASALALPVTAAVGARMATDIFRVGENEIYGGLSGQPMSKKEISRTMKRLNEQRAFQKSKIIIVNNDYLDTKDYSAEDFKSKLKDYSLNKNGVARIATKNRYVARVVPTVFGFGGGVMLFLFSDFVHAGEAESATSESATEGTASADFKRQSWARRKKE